MHTRIFRSARLVALGLAAAVVLTGCFENDFLTEYEGPTVVEFDQVAGRYSRSVQEGSGDTGLVGLTVNLIGPQRSSDTVINVDVIADGTTAVEEIGRAHV